MKQRHAHIVVFLLLTLFGTFSAWAQYYVTGQDRSNTHWKEIETQHFRIIFPDYYEAKAKKIALRCDTIFAYSKAELGPFGNKPQRKTPIILHPCGSYSNGVSAWAPKRIEFWTCPQQDGYSQPWLTQLTLHETRHELQMQALNQHLAGGITSALGEHFTGLLMGLFVPEWFLEGDATWAETALSNAGRGRESTFLTPAQVILANEKPSYYKSAFGSYKEYTMGPYLLGYLLVAHDKTTYDTANFWQNGLKRVSSDFWRLTPFYRRMQFKARYDSAMDFWQQQWEPFLTENDSSATAINAPQRHLTDYHLAGKTDSSVFALKKGVRDVSQIVEIMPDGSERMLAKTGSVCNNHMSLAGNRMAWTEYTIEHRWNLYHSNLVVMDLNNGCRRILTRNRNIFWPTLSQNGTIAALELTDSVSTRITLWDSTLQELPLHIVLPDSLEYQTPAISASDDSIFLSAISENGRYIILIDNILNTEPRTTFLAGPVWHNITQLAVHHGQLYFLSDRSGVNRISKLANGQELALSNNRFGISQFCLAENNNMLIYSQFTTNGTTIFRDSTMQCRKQTTYNFNSDAIAPAANKYRIPRLPTQNSTNYQSKDYNQWQHLFNFHSWAPFYLNANQMDVGLGISAMSQNELSNSILQSSLRWDPISQKPAISLSYQYLRLFPIISATVGFSGQSLKSEDTYYNFNLFGSTAEMQVPLRYYWHNHALGVTLSGSYGFSQMFFNNPSIQVQPTMNTVAVGASITHSTAKPTQYLYSPWQQSLSITVGYGFGSLHNISKIAMAASANFPSPIKTHTLRMYAGIQNRTRSLFSFANGLRTPRGFRHLNPNDMASSFQLNYDLPICHPDKAWGPVAYFKRIYATIFADAMLMHTNGKCYTSLGAEIYTNANLLLITTPVTFGLRASYLPYNGSVAFDLLFSVDV